MKKMPVNMPRLRNRLFEKMRQIKSDRYPTLSIWRGVYGGELPSSLAPIRIRRRPA
ncbi:hypothetical protein ABIB06_002188 [Bradyrhizobium sp. LB8.2]|uniref:hypothetical protein n=1 Tax=unclassified Bradyrhizobium TaxID=2631580 RepID=UPI003395622A